MKITTKHRASKHGQPVILGDDGKPMEYKEGLIAACKALGWTHTELAVKAGMKPRSLEPVFQGKMEPGAAVLNLLGDELEKLETK